MKSLLNFLILLFLVLTPEIRTSSSSSSGAFEVGEEEEIFSLSCDLSYESPNSIARIPLSPVDLVDKVAAPIANKVFEGLSPEILFYIGRFLEFPHRDIGGLSTRLRSIYSLLTPSKVIATQIGIQEVGDLPECSDLKYLIGGVFNEHIFDDKKLLFLVTIDVAMIKELPVIKRSLIRILYEKMIYDPSISREDLLETIHPFKTRMSPISAIFQAACDLKDFKMVFDIWASFPEMRPTTNFSFSDELIEAAIERDQIGLLYNEYAGGLNGQEKYNLATAILRKTMDQGILEMFFEEAYRPEERWQPNYTESFLNAWNHLLTFSSHQNEFKGSGKGEVLEVLSQFVRSSVDCFNDRNLEIRKLVTLLLISIRTGNTASLNSDLMALRSFETEIFQQFHELILWALVVEGFNREFLELLQDLELKRFDAIWLRRTIAKFGSDELIDELIARFNVNQLFSNNLDGEAVYNKRLFLMLTGNVDETTFITNSLLGKNLFEYGVIHFGASLFAWERFFQLRPDWTLQTFAKLLVHLLINLPIPQLFVKIKTLLVTGSIRIPLILSLSTKLKIFLRAEDVKFFSSHPELIELLSFLKLFIDFSSDCFLPPVMVSLINFDPNHVLVHLPHFAPNLRGLTAVEIKRAIGDLKDTHHGLPDQDELDLSILVLFKPILSKLNHLDYFYVLTDSLLKREIEKHSDKFKKALHFFEASQVSKLSHILIKLKRETIKLKGECAFPSKVERMLKQFKINLEFI